MGSSLLLDDGPKDARSEDASAPPAVPGAGRRPRPWLAFLLGLFFDGLGQLYVGQTALGLALSPLSVGLLALLSPATRLGAPLLASVLALLGAVLVARAGLGWAAARRARSFVKPPSTGLRRAAPYLAYLGCALAASAAYDMLSIRAVQAFHVPSGAMIPTVEIGDSVLVALAGARSRALARGDVVVFVVPVEPGGLYVKRVVGLAGDEITVRSGTVYVGDAPVTDAATTRVTAWDRDGVNGPWHPFEADAREEALGSHRYRVLLDRSVPTAGSDFGPYTVPPGHFFVMGDNRDRSFDSRSWGPVPLENLVGYAEVVYWSRGRDGLNWTRLGLAL